MFPILIDHYIVKKKKKASELVFRRGTAGLSFFVLLFCFDK